MSAPPSHPLPYPAVSGGRRVSGGIRSSFRLFAACTVLWSPAACEVVDPGPQVGVAGRCVVDSAYFIERIVPEYLEKYDCRNVGNGGCHDAGNGASIFRLQSTEGALMPLPTEPESAWPEPWQRNLDATAAQISDCDDARLSPLYSEPAGGSTRTHGGGDLFPPDGPELDLIQGWLDAGA